MTEKCFESLEKNHQNAFERNKYLETRFFPSIRKNANLKVRSFYSAAISCINFTHPHIASFAVIGRFLQELLMWVIFHAVLSFRIHQCTKRFYCLVIAWNPLECNYEQTHIRCGQQLSLRIVWKFLITN